MSGASNKTSEDTHPPEDGMKVWRLSKASWPAPISGHSGILSQPCTPQCPTIGASLGRRVLKSRSEAPICFLLNDSSMTREPRRQATAFSGLGLLPAAKNDEAVVWARVPRLSRGYTREISIGTRLARRWARGYPAHLGRDVPMAWVYFGVIVVFFAASIGMTALLERLRRGS